MAVHLDRFKAKGPPFVGQRFQFLNHRGRSGGLNFVVIDNRNEVVETVWPRSSPLPTLSLR